MTSSNSKTISQTSLKYGIAAGLAMSLTLLAFQSFSFDYAPWLKLTKYLFLIGFIAALISYVKQVNSGDFFASGMIAGLRASGYAALTLALVNLIIFMILPDFAFSKYTLVPDRIFDALSISGILLFEIFVFGGIITFFFLQMLKGSDTQLHEAIDQ